MRDCVLPAFRRLFFCPPLFGLIVWCGSTCVTYGALDEAGVAKQQNFIQTDNTIVQPDSVVPFSFVGSLKRTIAASSQTGTVTLPAGSIHSPNPFTVVSSQQLVGTHYYYAVPFASLNLLDAVFPAGTYRFDTTRNYFSGATTTTSQGVVFTGGYGMPSQTPKLSGTWASGRLMVSPTNPRVEWEPWSGPKSPDSRIELRVVGNNQSGWVTLRNFETYAAFSSLKPNGVYQASLRFLNVEDHQTVVDANVSDKDLGFTASYSAVTQFTVEMLPDPAWPLLGKVDTSPSLKALASTTSNTVVVGSSGKMAALDHATGTWQARDSVSSKTWNDVIYAGGQYVAVGSGGNVRTSPDGNVWTDRSTGKTEALQSIIWTGSQYLAVGDGGVILVSADGAAWTARSSGITTPLLTVAYSGGAYVAAGNFGIRISNDSINWRAPSNPGVLSSGSTVCWSRSKFLLATVFGANRLYQSTDGETWAPVAGFTDNVSRLVSVGGVAYAWGQGAQGAYFRRSLNGATWNEISMLGRVLINRLSWNGEALIALDAEGNILKGAGLNYEFFAFEGATSNHNEGTGSASLTVRRLGPSASARSVAYETEAGSALDVEDYVSSSGTLNFQVGETSKTLVFGLINDSQIEEVESFAVHLKSPATGAELGSPSTHWIGIVDDEPRPVFQFQLAEHTLSEEAGFVELNVVRTWDTASAATVNYATQSDGALAGVDFEGASGVVSFAGGETSRVIRINLIGNSAYEWPRSFSVNLSSPSSGSSLGAVTATVINLTNNDPAPVGLIILEALYGANGVRNDVKSQINANLNSNTVNMTVSASTMGGDPVPGSAKNLLLRYQSAEGHFSQTVSNGGILRIPSVQAQRLPMPFAQWQSTKFTAGEQADPLISGDTADPNQNGVPNLLEYAFDLDPKGAQAPWGSGALPGSEVMEVGGVNRLTLSYRPSVNVSNLSYIVEVSDNLASWDSGSEHVEQISTPGASPVVMADKTAVNGAGVGRRFIRLRVVRE